MRSAKSFPIVDALIALTAWVARWATRKSNLRQWGENRGPASTIFSHADGNASTVISSHRELLSDNVGEILGNRRKDGRRRGTCDLSFLHGVRYAGLDRSAV